MRGGNYVKIGSVCDIQNGFAFDSKLFNTEGKGLPLIRIRDIKRGYSETFTTEKCDDAFLVKEGDFLIGMDGEFNIGQWKSGVALLNQRVCKLVPSNKVLPKFIFYCIPKALKEIEARTAYATVKHLSSKQIKEICIPYPSLPEQQRIVDILDQEFAKIDALKANTEKSLQAAKDLFQATLKKELEPKEGWRTTTLGQSLKLTSGDNLTAKSLISGPFPVYGGNGIMGYHNQYNLDGQNLIVGRVGALCGNVRLVNGRIWYTDNAFLVHDKQNAFYLPFLSLVLTNANLRQYATQAAQPVVSNASMKDVLLSFPEAIEEQKRIVPILDDLNDRCNALQENYQKTHALCDDLKQALLRKAFNGEL